MVPKTFAVFDIFFSRKGEALRPESAALPLFWSQLSVSPMPSNSSPQSPKIETGH